MRVLALTAFLAVAAAAPASAVTIDPLKACYASDGEKPEQRETIRVHVTGFTPKGHLNLLIDGIVVFQGQADAFGESTAFVPAPYQGHGEREFTLAVDEFENPANAVATTSRVTNLSVTLRPNPARPSRKVRFSGRGFTNDARVFGHYLFGGKVIKRVRFARRSTAPCGVFHARRRQIPVRNPATGEWTLQVDQQRRYSLRPASNAQQVMITVREKFRRP